MSDFALLVKRSANRNSYVISHSFYANRDPLFRADLFLLLGQNTGRCENTGQSQVSVKEGLVAMGSRTTDLDMYEARGRRFYFADAFNAARISSSLLMAGVAAA